MRRARGQQDATLSITGRDVEEAEYALRFAPDLGAWLLLDGRAEDYTLDDTRRLILGPVREVGTVTPKAVAEKLGIAHNTAKQQIWKMSKDDQLDTDGSGTYFLPVTA
jgi:hypothetical protein